MATRHRQKENVVPVTRHNPVNNPQPWLENKQWKDSAIASNASAARWAIWIFAGIWNIFNLVLLFQIGDILHKIQHDPLTALILLFPLVGVGLIIAAARATQQYQKFGPTPLTLDPFPGSLGGHVGGHLSVPIPYNRNQHFNVSLSCIHSTMRGSGKNRSRSESIKWQSQGICHSSDGGGTTKLHFRFDAPSNLPPSDARPRGSYNLWRVHIASTLDGPDFDRSFNIPVYTTANTRSSIVEGTESNSDTLDAAMDGIQTVANIRSIPLGIEAYFPAMQRPMGGVVFTSVGLIFATIGIALGFQKISFLVVVFTLMGTGFALGGFYSLSKSLLVKVTLEGLKTRRYLFGYPITSRQLAATGIRSIEVQKGSTVSSGNKTTVFYSLEASAKTGKGLRTAERLSGRAEAELLKETYETYLAIS